VNDVHKLIYNNTGVDDAARCAKIPGWAQFPGSNAEVQGHVQSILSTSNLSDRQSHIYPLPNLNVTWLNSGVLLYDTRVTLSSQMFHLITLTTPPESSNVIFFSVFVTSAGTTSPNTYS